MQCKKCVSLPSGHAFFGPFADGQIYFIAHFHSGKELHRFDIFNSWKATVNYRLDCHVLSTRSYAVFSMNTKKSLIYFRKQ